MKESLWQPVTDISYFCFICLFCDKRRGTLISLCKLKLRKKYIKKIQPHTNQISILSLCITFTECFANINMFIFVGPIVCWICNDVWYDTAPLSFQVFGRQRWLDKWQHMYNLEFLTQGRNFIKEKDDKSTFSLIHHFMVL